MRSRWWWVASLGGVLLLVLLLPALLVPVGVAVADEVSPSPSPSSSVVSGVLRPLDPEDVRSPVLIDREYVAQLKLMRQAVAQVSAFRAEVAGPVEVVVRHEYPSVSVMVLWGAVGAGLVVAAGVGGYLLGRRSV